MENSLKTKMINGMTLQISPSCLEEQNEIHPVPWLRLCKDTSTPLETFPWQLGQFVSGEMSDSGPAIVQIFGVLIGKSKPAAGKPA